MVGQNYWPAAVVVRQRERELTCYGLQRCKYADPVVLGPYERLMHPEKANQIMTDRYDCPRCKEWKTPSYFEQFAYRDGICNECQRKEDEPYNPPDVSDEAINNLILSWGTAECPPIDAEETGVVDPRCGAKEMTCGPLTRELHARLDWLMKYPPE